MKQVILTLRIENEQLPLLDEVILEINERLPVKLVEAKIEDTEKKGRQDRKRVSG